MEKKILKKPKISYEVLPSTAFKDLFVSSKTLVPGWYKQIPQYEMPNEKRTAKLCVPFLESFLSGYMIVLPYDIYVKNIDGSPFLFWANEMPNTPSFRDSPGDVNLVPAGHFPKEFVWRTNVAWTVPKGYSALFTHPLNRHDLPFTTLSAVIDGGLAVSPVNNVPFYVKVGFEGLIPQGTPIAQIIPFRQENWKSEKKDGLNDLALSHNNLAMSVFKGWYKKTFWVKKEYN